MKFPVRRREVKPLPAAALEGVLPGEARVATAAHRSLDGQARGIRAVLPFLGPAFIASVAYIDPGNFATNVAAGSKFGYLLLWVILSANLMAMLIQSMSAKLGIATGMNLAEVCRERTPAPVRIGLWIQAELIAMATDLAEFVGAALGMSLLFGLDLWVSGLVTAVAAFAILDLQRRGVRPLEIVITMFVGVIVVGFAIQVALVNVDYGAAATGLTVPKFSGTESLLLASGIIGATVMPHVIYLHSALTQRRVVGKSDEERRKIFRFERIDVIIAMSIAGLVNISMLLVAAAVFHSRGLTDVADIDEVYNRLGSLVGGHASQLFGIALLASGLSSSSVGTLAGQVVMQGFIRRQIPLMARRAITMAPALVVLFIGVNTSQVLIASQVVLSLGIPFALIPLLRFTSQRDLMGPLVNRKATIAIATIIVTMIVSLNVFLIAQLLVG